MVLIFEREKPGEFDYVMISCERTENNGLSKIKIEFDG